MRAIRCWAACWLMSVGLLGCGGPSGSADAGSRVDSGSADAASVDTGALVDAPRDAARTDAPVSPPDGGGCGSDAGAAPGDCVLYVPVGSFGPLTNACLPRCSAATATAYRACTSQSCRSAATAADTTPGVSYYIGSAHITSPLDCEGCVSYQQFHCFSLVCGSEVNSYVDECIAGGGASSCDFAIANVDACLGALSPAEEATVDACYASHDGIEGCFPCQ